MKLIFVGMIWMAALVTLGAQADLNATEPHDAEQLGTVAIETDQCGSVVHVALKTYGEFKTIPRGEWTRVDNVRFSNGRFPWKCGDTQEFSGCPGRTKALEVFHSKTSREITWHCQDP